jgi:hypothetical protein
MGELRGRKKKQGIGFFISACMAFWLCHVELLVYAPPPRAACHSVKAAGGADIVTLLELHFAREVCPSDLLLRFLLIAWIMFMKITE